MSTTTTARQTFTPEERAAMKARADELKEATKQGAAAEKTAEAEQAVLAKIAEMSDSDRAIAEQVHAVVAAAAPGLTPKLWYGMPAYALDGKIVCHFQPAAKFKTRYATLGFSDQAKLDDGAIWETSFAITEPTAETEARIKGLLRRALT